MSERHQGWYWIRVDNGQWESAHLSSTGKISRSGTTIRMSEDMLVEFGPRIPSPDEPWVTVPKQHTIDMSIAHGEEFYSKRRCIDDDDIQDIWSALLEAAPKP